MSEVLICGQHRNAWPCQECVVLTRDGNAVGFFPVSLEDRIDEWHESGTNNARPLHEFLGWTWEEYVEWGQSGKVPETKDWRDEQA